RAQTRRRPPRVAPTTARADKPVEPPQPRQVVDTGLLVTEPLGELLVGPRIIHSTHRPRRLVHQLTLLHSSRDADPHSVFNGEFLSSSVSKCIVLGAE